MLRTWSCKISWIYDRWVLCIICSSIYVSVVVDHFRPKKGSYLWILQVRKIILSCKIWSLKLSQNLHTGFMYPMRDLWSLLSTYARKTSTNSSPDNRWNYVCFMRSLDILVSYKPSSTPFPWIFDFHTSVKFTVIYGWKQMCPKRSKISSCNRAGSSNLKLMESWAGPCLNFSLR